MTRPFLCLPLAALCACATSSKPIAAAPPAPAQVSGDTPPAADAPELERLARQAGALAAVYSNNAPVFVPGSSRIAFISDRDGLPQLYLADLKRPAEPAERLVTTPDRIVGTVALADGKSLLFVSDTDADENYAIFRLELATRQITPLTPGPKLSRDFPLIPLRAPDRMFFGARALDATATTVYEASPLAPKEARAVYRDAGSGYLTDVTQDGKTLLFEQFPTRSDNHLLVVDVTTGASRPLYPLTGRATITEALFSPDGSRVYVATDGGAEQALVLVLETKTGKELARYVEKAPATATIQDLLLSEAGDRLALSLHCGNRTDVRLLDPKTLQPIAAVALPLGEGEPSEFSPDGRTLLLSWSTPNSPRELFAVDVRSGKAGPVRAEARAGMEQLPRVDVTMTEVTSFDGMKIPVNVFLPANAKGKLPVIVRYHGGPAGSAEIRWSPTARFFVSQGYAWVEPNVRGSGGFGRAFEEADNGPKRLDAFKDVERAAQWVAEQPWADKQRMVVYGESYGGYTVLVSLTRHPSLWRAGVDMSGLANLKTFMATTSGFVRQNFTLELGDPERDGAFLESISPLKDVAKIRAPLFVYAGANDPRVPRSEADQIVAALRDRKVPVEYMMKADEGHGLSRKESQVEFYSRVALFLDRALR